MKWLDTRFAGMAMGIGTSRILGRIHKVELEIGGHIFPCSLTVLEDNKVEFLLGLDNLKRH
jgi:DNA damage-inducible protein 1